MCGDRELFVLGVFFVLGAFSARCCWEGVGWGGYGVPPGEAGVVFPGDAEDGPFVDVFGVTEGFWVPWVG